MKFTTITRNELIEKLRDPSLVKTKEQVTVLFTKKDGSKRTLIGSFGVNKKVTNEDAGELAYDPEEKNLMCIYDVVNDGYRMINLNTLEKAEIRGEVFVVTG